MGKRTKQTKITKNVHLFGSFWVVPFDEPALTRTNEPAIFDELQGWGFLGGGFLLTCSWNPYYIPSHCILGIALVGKSPLFNLQERSHAHSNTRATAN